MLSALLPDSELPTMCRESKKHRYLLLPVRHVHVQCRGCKQFWPKVRRCGKRYPADKLLSRRAATRPIWTCHAWWRSSKRSSTCDPRPDHTTANSADVWYWTCGEQGANRGRHVPLCRHSLAKLQLALRILAPCCCMPSWHWLVTLSRNTPRDLQPRRFIYFHLSAETITSTEFLSVSFSVAVKTSIPGTVKQSASIYGQWVQGPLHCTTASMTVLYVFDL